MSKKLVAYFSASGTTAKVAKALAEAAGADLYEIKPQNPYTEDDLKWWVEGNRSVAETLDKDFRPAIVNDDAHIEKYDTIYLGFPIWCYVAPRIINTFLEKYDFSNKKIILFATSGGSRWGDTVKELKVSVDPSCIIETSTVNGR